MKDTAIIIGKATGICQDCYSGVALIKRPATVKIGDRDLCDYRGEQKMVAVSGRIARIKRKVAHA